MSRREQVAEEMCSELGRLVMAVNAFESILFDLYCGLANRPRADLVQEVRNLMLPDFVATFAAEFRRRVHAPELVAAFNSIEPQILPAARRRNEFIHSSYWLANDEAGFEQHRRPRTGGEQLQNIDPSQVFAVTHTFMQLSNEVVSLRERLADARIGGVVGYALEPSS